LKRRRYLTTEALARVARGAGVRQEQRRVRVAWKKGLFAIRSAGSGSGTSALEVKTGTAFIAEYDGKPAGYVLVTTQAVKLGLSTRKATSFTAAKRQAASDFPSQRRLSFPLNVPPATNQ